MAKDSAEFMIDILDSTANLTFLCMVSSLYTCQMFDDTRITNMRKNVENAKDMVRNNEIYELTFSCGHEAVELINQLL